MTWTTMPTRVPTSIGQMIHMIRDIPGDQSIDYFLVVHDAEGLPMRVLSGNEVPHLTAGQINDLQIFLADQRVVASTAWPDVEEIHHRIIDQDGTTGGRSIRFTVVRTSGTTEGNEVPYLTEGQITALHAICDTQRAKAVAEIL